MHAVTPPPPPLSALDGLLDLERSQAFHAGQVAVDLSRMRALVERLPPLRHAPLAVHVAGSEGKTSATERIAAGLIAHGLRVGTFTSPHLRDPLERLRVDLALPPVDAVRAAAATVLASAGDLAPSWFEALTATARQLFDDLALDAIVWETGLGGRLDATRTMDAELAVLTSISLEHTAVLGPTLAAVTREKADILRPGRPAVLGAGLPSEALAVIEDVASRRACPLVVAGRDDDDPSLPLARAVLDRLAAAGRLPPRTPAVDAALLAHRVEGRSDLRGEVLFDGAHTVAATTALARRLAGQPVARLVFGSTTGRDAAALLAPLMPVCEGVILTRPPFRGADPTELAAGLEPSSRDRVAVVPDPQAALARARTEAGAGRRIVVTGSLYLVGCLLPPRSAPA